MSSTIRVRDGERDFIELKPATTDQLEADSRDANRYSLILIYLSTDQQLYSILVYNYVERQAARLSLRAGEDQRIYNLRLGETRTQVTTGGPYGLDQNITDPQSKLGGSAVLFVVTRDRYRTDTARRWSTGRVSACRPVVEPCFPPTHLTRACSPTRWATYLLRRRCRGRTMVTLALRSFLNLTNLHPDCTSRLYFLDVHCSCNKRSDQPNCRTDLRSRTEQTARASALRPSLNLSRRTL
ncbi:hypothetical protein RRG08_010432 [Elysia crispata]|uniref:Uncharacterized protein n=1 Tax=Elysia crispata TaxID=231223 RepID=A0AAE1DVY5_9GAST|nr:hypothetical protein RRG08_010432 [Elysia crispata]